jgi:hypothetical protein
MGMAQRRSGSGVRAHRAAAGRFPDGQRRTGVAAYPPTIPAAASPSSAVERLKEAVSPSEWPFQPLVFTHCILQSLKVAGSRLQPAVPPQSVRGANQRPASGGPQDGPRPLATESPRRAGAGSAGPISASSRPCARSPAPQAPTATPTRRPRPRRRPNAARFRRRRSLSPSPGIRPSPRRGPS